MSIRIRHTLLFFLPCFVAGCGYSCDSLYRTDIETVFVPVFDSSVFRRQVEYEITGALCRRIESRTPYKIVSDAAKADTILYGRVVGVAEKVLTQQRDLDRPLENQLVLAVNVSWKDLRNNKMLINEKAFRVSGDYAALLGDTADSAVSRAAEELAVSIVEKMEKPW